jgi:hypothetical protein
MTEQEVFDKVAKHLLTQNARSLGPSSTKSNGMCAYRGNDGLVCAAGCLIPDEAYKPWIENKSWGDLLSSNFVPSHKYSDLIIELQIVHDDYLPDKWQTQLNRLAQKRKLNFIFKDCVFD